MNNTRLEKIFIIDPDKFLTDELAGRLINVGFEVVTANDTITALKLIEVIKPSLILLDIKMKDQNDKDILLTLKGKSVLSNIPIIIMTSETDVNSKVYGFLNGASDYIVKPVIFQEVLVRINHHINLLNMQKDLEIKNQELLKKNQILEQMAITDSLTGLYNKGHIMKRLKSELLRAGRYGETLSVIMLDIDNFKNINDTYGHLKGDKVLKHVSRQIINSVRDVDIVSRYGGEEFLLVCPNTGLKGSYILGERIRTNIEQSGFYSEGEYTQTTVSLGITASLPTSPYDMEKMLEQLIGEADMALYNAKNKGKNRTETFEYKIGSKLKETPSVDHIIPQQQMSSPQKYAH